MIGLRWTADFLSPPFLLELILNNCTAICISITAMAARLHMRLASMNSKKKKNIQEEEEAEEALHETWGIAIAPSMQMTPYSSQTYSNVTTGLTAWGAIWEININNHITWGERSDNLKQAHLFEIYVLFVCCTWFVLLKKTKHDAFSSLTAGQEVYDFCDEGVWNDFILILSIYLDDVSVL